jgi:mannose-6-phosphate isomerase-like protein (cupin superfamily)
LAASVFLGSAALAAAQNAAPRTEPGKATYITKEEIGKVTKAFPTGDKNIKVVDIGHENFAVGIVHRGKTVNGKQVEATDFRMPPPAPEPCGKKMDKVPATGGYPGGITHNVQTEGYYIVSGSGTMFTDGYVVNGRDFDLAEINGPTCIGLAYDVTLKAVKEGDIVIIPAGVVHGWLDVPDHVDYLSFRPSPGVLTAGWANPAIKP